MSTLERAIAIATEAHEGCADKGGEPYILHPIRLMMKFETETYRIVAVLHDVIEDSDLTLEDLEKEGFSDRVIAAVNAMTKRKHDSYDDYINRVSNDIVARKVKIEDLKDNLQVTRLISFTDSDSKRVKKYMDALWKLRY